MKTTARLFIVMAYLLALPSLSHVFAQQKHALLVFISDYPQRPENHQAWSLLNAAQDRIIVRNMLAKQQFNDEHISELIDDQASVDQLRKSFEKLLEQVKEGDIVYFHYSGHGQLIEDQNSDEKDGFDEALALYNAPNKWYRGYEYGEHFKDDELNLYMERIRKKLGAKGQVIVVLDSCHSGSASRGSTSQLSRRGANNPCAPDAYIQEHNLANYEKDQLIKTEKKPEMANFTCYYGCQSYETNHEYEYVENGIKNKCGSLTYFLATAITTLDSLSSHQNLFSKIQTEYATKLNKQNPAMESDNLNGLIFNGQLIKQTPFITLEKINWDNEWAIINAGSIQGLQFGDTIGFYPNSTANPKTTSPVFKGTVSKVMATTSEVNFVMNPTGKTGAPGEFRAFLIGAVSIPNQISIKLEIKEKKLDKLLRTELGNLPWVKLSDDLSDFTLCQSDPRANDIDIIVSANNLINSSVSVNPTNKEGVPDLLSNLNKLNRIKSFINLTIDDPSVFLTVKLKSEKSTFKQEERDSLTIQNGSRQMLHLYIINIDPDYRIRSADEDKRNVIVKMTLDANQRFVSDPIFCCSEKDGTFAPCGTTVTKIIASTKQLDGLEQILELNTNNYTSKRGSPNDLLPYFNQHLEGKTRSGNTSTPKMDVINWIYSISP